MIFQHHRFQIWSKAQHPYAHSLDEFTYLNDSLPIGEVQNAKQAMDWILAVIYPNQQPAVATPAALPAGGNTINDYRVVNDDGDGKAASYRWEQREGDVAAQWYKIYDMDWGEASILSNFLTKTQDVYVFRYGIDDLDETGTPYAGDLAGQRIYGGQSAGTHLTLYSNSGDGVGAGTGYVQFGDNSRPLVDSSFSLGTNTYRFLNFYTDEANVGTLQILAGQITDSSGAISFGDENLSTTGTILSGTLLLQGGSITDSTGTIDFVDENLTTTGLVTADGGLDVGNVEIRTGGLFNTTAASAVDFTFTPDGGTSLFIGDLECTNDLTAGNANFNNIVTIESPDTTERLIVDQLDSGVSRYTSTSTHQFVAGATVTLDMDATDMNVYRPTNFRGSPTSWWSGATEYLRVTSGRIDSLTVPLTIDGGASLTLDGTLNVRSAKRFFPTANGTLDLGLNFLDHGLDLRWRTLALSTAITDGATQITMATLLSFRDALVGAASGMSLFYDGAKWNASIPDTEIDHGTIGGLGDDDHTQYVLLAGRTGAGGQVIHGGTIAGDNLVLDSTSNATKGWIETRSDLIPNGDGTIIIGENGASYKELWMSGEAFGLRMENAASFGVLPGASASNPGRLAWVVDTETIYVDNGGVWKQITSDKYSADDAVTWDGVNVTQTYTTSGDIDDARDAIWQFLDNTNGFQVVSGAVITKTQTQVTVTFTIPPASGTYRLVGVG